MRKIRKNDDVIILSGKDKGRSGKVLSVLTSGQKVLVEGINMVKKHMKPNPQAQQPGGIIEKEAPLHISNVAIKNSVTGKADRVGFKVVDGKKHRYYKSNGEIVGI